MELLDYGIMEYLYIHFLAFFTQTSSTVLSRSHHKENCLDLDLKGKMFTVRPLNVIVCFRTFVDTICQIKEILSNTNFLRFSPY